MQPSPDNPARERALFLTPEAPRAELGGGSMRSASLLAYLQSKFDVDGATFDLPYRSRSFAARAWRNSIRCLNGRPPLFDRYSGLEHQLKPKGRYRIAVIEHFWCAGYADLLRPHADLLVLDLHNIESALSRSHIDAAHGLEALAFRRFASAYEALERRWLPRFDLLLTPSAEDRGRAQALLRSSGRANTRVEIYPNALPASSRPPADEENAIVFSGNLEYDPNVAAVRWFGQHVWPELKELVPDLEWRIVGRNPEFIRRFVERDPRIRLTGALADTMPEIAKAKVCIVPLLSGSGTRFKILEAWAARRAVVSTSIGAEGLGAKSGIHLLTADHADAFRDAVLAALESSGLRRGLGDCGHALLESRYTWPRAWEALDRALGRNA